MIFKCFTTPRVTLCAKRDEWVLLCCCSVAGVGYATQVIVALLNVYYVVVLAWAIFYLSQSFTWDLPWASCNNTWNTGTVLVILLVLYFMCFEQYLNTISSMNTYT